MTDQLFSTWPYKTSDSTSTAIRTTPNRFADVKNVKDFFPSASPTAAQTLTAINAAVAACSTGGVVYFPAGDYNINAPIILPNDSKGRMFIGQGKFSAAGNGTHIYGSPVHSVSGLLDYLLVTPPSPTLGGTPISLIEGIFFENQGSKAKGAMTSIDTSVISPTADPVTPGTGYGCVYLNNSHTAVRDCAFSVNGGIGLVMMGIQNVADNCVVNGNSARLSTSPESVGIWIDNGCIRGGKIYQCWWGIVPCQFGGVDIRDLNVEVNVNGIWAAANPLAFFDRNSSTGVPGGLIQPAGSQGCDFITISHVNMDSHGQKGGGSSGSFITSGAPNIIMDTMKLENNGDGSQDYGIRIMGLGSGAQLSNIIVSGAHTIAGIQIEGTIRVRCNNVTAMSTATPWVLSGTTIGPHSFEECNIPDSVRAVPLSKLPTGLSGAIQEAWIGDSRFPAFNGTASNFGRPATGGGPYKAKVGWNGAQWAIIGGEMGADPIVSPDTPATVFATRLHGTPGATQSGAYTTLINTLVTKGLIRSDYGTSDYLDCLFVAAVEATGGTAAADAKSNALLNLINGKLPGFVSGIVTHTMTASGGGGGAAGFSVASGSTGNGVFTNVGITGGKWSRPAGHMSVWVADNPAASDNYACGFYDWSSPDWEISTIAPRFVSGVADYRINQRYGTAFGSITTASSQGFYFANRADATTFTAYKNKVLQSPLSGTLQSQYVPIIGSGGVPFCAGWNNNGGSANLDNGFPGKIAAFTMGAPLTSTQSNDLYDALRAYMTTMGVP